ncbi:hypothetical protein EVJ58_g528 [Rhodofomes roseus]|uniref:Uncharacterized protein n=1 Tax=Rhodofomes roseus TaxID=34475 RepID=A0A4Y9Z5X7_9APHY|nr:hypothetical protein EVJ58_g528 [Rhodofomes roseus]
MGISGASRAGRNALVNAYNNNAPPEVKFSRYHDPGWQGAGMFGMGPRDIQEADQQAYPSQEQYNQFAMDYQSATQYQNQPQVFAVPSANYTTPVHATFNTPHIRTSYPNPNSYDLWQPQAAGPLLKEFQKVYIPEIKKGIESIIMVTLGFPTEDEIPQLVKAVVVWKATQNDLHSDLIPAHVHRTLVDYDAANNNVLRTKAKQMIGMFRGIFKSMAATLFPITHKVHLVPPEMLSLIEQDLGELGLECNAACTSRQEWATKAIDSTLQTTPLLHELSQQNQSKFNTDSVHTSKNFTTDSYKRKAGLFATHIKGLKAADTDIGAHFRHFNSNIVHARSIWAKLPRAGQLTLVEFDVEVSIGKAWE